MPVDIEVVRNFWNKRPCNVRHSAKKLASSEYFSEITNRRYKVEPHIKEFADFEKYEGKKVLEIGCGIGTDAEQFVKAGAQYTGIDLSDESVKLTKERLPGANVMVANIEEWCSDQKYDLIYSFGVLHHTPNIHNALCNIRKMLSPGGELKIMMYATNSWKNAMISMGLDQYEAQSGVPVANTYTMEQIKTLLSDFNLTISKRHIFRYSIPEYKMGQYVFSFPWNYVPAWGYYILERLMGWHLLITASR